MTTVVVELAAKLDAGISAHSSGKVRLEKAFNDGTSVDPVQLERDDACELGKWIHSANAAMKAAPYYSKVRDLHCAFHKEAASVLRQGRAGRKREALKGLQPGGTYGKISSELVLTMANWKRNL